MLQVSISRKKRNRSTLLTEPGTCTSRLSSKTLTTAIETDPSSQFPNYFKIHQRVCNSFNVFFSVLCSMQLSTIFCPITTLTDHSRTSPRHRPMQNEEQEVTVLQPTTSLSTGKRDTQSYLKTKWFSSFLQLHIPRTPASQLAQPEPYRQHPLHQAWISRSQ